MNSYTRLKLCSMVENGVINQNSLTKFLISKPTSNIQVKNFIKECNDFSIDDINQFKIKLFDSWSNVDKTFKSNEIPVLTNLLNNGSVMTRKELITKTRLAPDRITKAISTLIGTPYDNAVSGLIEEGIVDTIPIFRNEILVFINKKKFYNFLKNGKN